MWKSTFRQLMIEGAKGFEKTNLVKVIVHSIGLFTAVFGKAW